MSDTPEPALVSDSPTDIPVRREAFVDAAVVASKLHTIIKITDGMHLSSLNAMIITAKAGDDGRGFRPLTEFISELARSTAKLVHQINHEALEVSRTAINKMRAENAQRDFRRAGRLHTAEGDVACPSALKSLIREAGDELDGVTENFESHFRELMKYLSEIDMQIKSARFISSNCRIEAAHVTGFRGDFEAVAESLSQSAAKVKALIEECQTLLGHQEVAEALVAADVEALAA